ncbi:MAG: ABC transporter permease [Prevotellaceae bacterium]|nr:ABC transporter permease [Prevotellaceae bacterium]
MNIINMVSHISFVGVICGTAALIIVLSVFNGFENLTHSIFVVFDPELKVVPKQGKTFVVDSAKIREMEMIVGVEKVSPVLEENVLLKCGDKQTIAFIRGVSSNYETNASIGNSIYAGEFKTYLGDCPSLVLGYGVAAKLGIFNPVNENPILVYVPKRNAVLSTGNPANSLNTMGVCFSGIFEVEKHFDDMYAFAPIEFVRELLERESQASAIEIRLKHETDVDAAARAVKKIAGDEMSVKTRFMQNETVYRMMKSEKLIVYAILMLIVIILSFNISGSLSMLMTEKKADIATLQSLGATGSLIKNIFLSVGLSITVIGIAAGLTVGLAICFLQQYCGLLKLPGNNMLVSAYPVQVLLSDILAVTVSVFFIGCTASFISVFYGSNQLSRMR